MFNVDWRSKNKVETSVTSVGSDIFNGPSFKGRASRGVEGDENTAMVLDIRARALEDYPPLKAKDGEGSFSSESLLGHDYADVVLIGLIDKEGGVVSLEGSAVPGDAF